MCVEKTPWEQVIDFHGHNCLGIAIGFRVSQIATRELGIRPTPDSELLVEAKTRSCALDAFQVLNHTTIGRRTLVLKESGKHIYSFHFTGTTEILRIAVNPDIILQLADFRKFSNNREKQNKTLEGIQWILTIEEQKFCTIERIQGVLPKVQSSHSWSTCSSCGDAVLEAYATYKDGQLLCPDCCGQ